VDKEEGRGKEEEEVEAQAEWEEEVSDRAARAFALPAGQRFLMRGEIPATRELARNAAVR